MSISSTIGGVTKEITPSATVGGVVREFDTVHTVVGGVLKEIFSKGGGLPTSLTWDRNTGDDNYSVVYTEGTSEDGLTVKYRAYTFRSTGRVTPGNFSNFFTVPAGTVITFTPTSISGSGTTVDIMEAYLYDADGEVTVVSMAHTQIGETRTITVEEAGEYQIRLGGYSQTVTNTSTGPTYTYYDVTVTVSISFS